MLNNRKMCACLFGLIVTCDGDRYTPLSSEKQAIKKKITWQPQTNLHKFEKNKRSNVKKNSRRAVRRRNPSVIHSLTSQIIHIDVNTFLYGIFFSSRCFSRARRMERKQNDNFCPTRRILQMMPLRSDELPQFKMIQVICITFRDSYARVKFADRAR